MKKKEGYSVSNSYYNLNIMKRLLLNEPIDLICKAGEVFCFIDTDGKFYPCFDMRGRINGKKFFFNLPKIKTYCDFCRCNGSLEINAIYNFKSLMDLFNWW